MHVWQPHAAYREGRGAFCVRRTADGVLVGPGVLSTREAMDGRPWYGYVREVRTW